MARPTRAAVLLVVCLGLFGCRPDTVSLGFAPDADAAYRYRYEVQATVTRRVDGGAPRSTVVSMTFESVQTVVDETAAGTLMQVTLTSEDSTPRSAVVLLDRAGSLQAIQQVEGLPVDAIGLPSAGTLLASTATEPPDHPLSVGDRWAIADGLINGEGRLDHLGVVDGEGVAVVTATLLEVLTDTVEADGSEVVLDGDLRSTTSTTFDLRDGSVRRSDTHSSGRVDVVVSAPIDVVAAPVEAVVTYELQVRTTRLD